MAIGDTYRNVRTRDVYPMNADDVAGHHTHIYLNRSGPNDTAGDFAASDLPRSRTRDAIFGATKPPSQGGSTPGIKTKRALGDDDPDDYDLSSAAVGTVLATLPMPPQDKHYELEMREDGYVVVLEDGPPRSDAYETETEVGDRLSYGPGGNPKIRRMNDAARKFWRNGARTTDADVEHVVLTWRILADDEKLVLRGPNSAGDYEVVLIRPSKNVVGSTPLGASGTGPELRSKGATAPSRTGDKLRQMNAANRKFWSGARR